MVSTKTPETLDRPDMSREAQFTPEDTPKLKAQTEQGIQYCGDRADLSADFYNNTVGPQGLDLLNPKIQQLDADRDEQLDAAQEEKATSCKVSQDVYNTYLKGDKESFTQSVGEAASATTQGFSEIGSNTATQAVG